MDIIIVIFFSGLIATKGIKYTYFIKYKIKIAIFKFIINISNYKAEAISPIINVIFETALS